MPLDDDTVTWLTWIGGAVVSGFVTAGGAIRTLFWLDRKQLTGRVEAAEKAFAECRREHQRSREIIESLHKKIDKVLRENLEIRVKLARLEGHGNDPH